MKVNRSRREVELDRDRIARDFAVTTRTRSRTKSWGILKQKARRLSDVALRTGPLNNETKGTKSTTGRPDNLFVPCDRGPSKPVELGDIEWLPASQFRLSKIQSQKTGRPILVLFAEVPGEMETKDFGQEVLQDPKVVQYVQDRFIPVHINTGSESMVGADASIAKQMKERSNFKPVLRVLTSEGDDVINRIADITTPEEVLGKLQEAQDLFMPETDGTEEVTPVWTRDPPSTPDQVADYKAFMLRKYYTEMRIEERRRRIETTIDPGSAQTPRSPSSVSGAEDHLEQSKHAG